MAGACFTAPPKDATPGAGSPGGAREDPAETGAIRTPPARPELAPGTWHMICTASSLLFGPGFRAHYRNTRRQRGKTKPRGDPMTEPTLPWNRAYLEARTVAHHLSQAVDALALSEKLTRNTHPQLSYQAARALAYAGPAKKAADRILKDLELKHAPQADLIKELDTLEAEIQEGMSELERRHRGKD